MTIMEKLIKDVARITGYDYSEYKNKVGKESILEALINDLLESYEEKERELESLQNEVEEYGIDYPTYEDAISYSHNW